MSRRQPYAPMRSIAFTRPPAQVLYNLPGDLRMLRVRAFMLALEASYWCNEYDDPPLGEVQLLTMASEACEQEMARYHVGRNGTNDAALFSETFHSVFLRSFPLALAAFSEGNYRIMPGLDAPDRMTLFHEYAVSRLREIAG